MQLPKNRLQELREERGLRRVDLAAHCDVGEATIRRWELGITEIADRHKLALAELLEVPVAQLMGWDAIEQQQEAAAA